MDWLRVLDMALGAVFGGGLVGTWLQIRHQRSLHRDQRRERAADVLADTISLAEDLKPSHYAFASAENRPQFDKVKARHEQLRRRLLLVAAGHPSLKVRELERELNTALDNTVALVDWLVDEAAEGSDYAKKLCREAWVEYEKADRLLSDFMKAI